MEAPTIIRWPTFTAVRVRTKTATIIAHLGKRFELLPSISKVEVYEIGDDGYTETFLGYLDHGEKFARVVPGLICAAERALTEERCAAIAAKHRRPHA